MTVRAVAETQKAKKTASEISNLAEKRIVKVSLQNPDFDASRLVPLLEKDGIAITASAVYTILKRNNLQNRALRLSKLAENCTAKITALPADAEQEPSLKGEVARAPRAYRVIKSSPETRVRRTWSLNLANILLLGLVGYFWVSTLGNLLEARREPVLLPQAVSAEINSKPEANVRSLADYSIIYERNLFAASQGQVTAREEGISVEDIPIAEKIVGLKLVGTVAGDDSATSFAIIDSKITGKQEFYHEGDKAGEVLIKKVMRNKVIVDAGRGDEVLTLELEESGKKIDLALTPQPPVDLEPEATRRIHQNFQLNRQKVQSSLGNVEQLIQQAGISPYLEGERPAGFTISKVEPDSVFAKMGLGSGDAILAVNDEAITGLEQAGQFVQRLRDGGDVVIKVKKGRGVRSRTRVIRIHIE
jgi:type II secretion system protein C